LEEPYVDTEDAAKTFNTPPHRALARVAARANVTVLIGPARQGGRR